MSTETLQHHAPSHADPELPLSPLGKRIELLRVERQIPKQRLARHAGTSRQQLWRIMTGKSELTTAMRERLALALAIQPGDLDAGGRAPSAGLAGTAAPAESMAGYLADARAVERTLATLPSGEEGSQLKRAVLSALEDVALRSRSGVPEVLLGLRRRVLAGEL